MARIFTTKFHFNQKAYDAIITLTDKNGNPSFNIRLLDDELHELIPNGHLRYEGRDGFKSLDTAESHLTQSLVNCIAASIDNHLVSTS